MRWLVSWTSLAKASRPMREGMLGCVYLRQGMEGAGRAMNRADRGEGCWGDFFTAHE